MRKKLSPAYPFFGILLQQPPQQIHTPRTELLSISEFYGLTFNFFKDVFHLIIKFIRISEKEENEERVEKGKETNILLSLES